MKKQITVDQILTKKAVWDVLETTKEEAKNADAIIVVLVKDNNVSSMYSSLNRPHAVYTLELARTSLVMEELL